MDFIKKQGIGTWITLATIVLSIIGLILYGVALNSGMGLTIANGSQPFYDAGRDEDSVMIATVTALGIIALVAFIASIALKEVSFYGTAAKVTSIVSDALRIIAPALLFIVMLTFVYGSFTGLGWTFFSNEELEIFPKAISTGKTVITGAVFFLLAAISGTVASFFEITKKQA